MSESFPRLKVESNGPNLVGAKVLLDGQPVRGLRALKVEMTLDGFSTAVFEIAVDGVEIDADLLLDLVAQAEKDKVLAASLDSS